MNYTVEPLKSDGYSWINPPTNPDEVDSEYVDQMRANSLIEWCRELEEEQKAVHELNLRHYQFYSNRFLAAFDWGDNRFTSASLEPVTTTTDNVIIQVVDALTAEIGKNRPKAKPVLFGASHSQQKLARKLDKFLYGEFIRNNIYEVAKSALLNAFICGFGCVRVEMEYIKSRKGKKVSEQAQSCLTNVFPDDIIIDNTEYNNTGQICSIAYRRVLPAKVVKATYGLTDAQIEKAATFSGSYLTYRSVQQKWIVVVEAHRIAMGDTPGRRVVAIPGTLIEDEEWEYDWLPYVFYHWSRPNKTFYTQSVVEQALPNQIRLIEINQVIHRCQEIVSRPRLLIQQGSKVNPMEINNLNAKLIMYTGVKPEALKWDAVNAELYNEREREIKICFDKFGLNQMSASGGLPQSARLDSSAAVREYNQIQDGRLVDPTQRYENFFLDLARTIIRVIKASGESPRTVWYSGGRRSRAETIDWKDVELDDDCYTLILEAASSFSMTPSAMRDSLEDQLVKGLITPEEYKYQLGAPDMDSLTAVASAGYNDICRVVELLEEGKYEAPTIDQDLVNGVKLVQLHLLMLNVYDEEEELENIKLGFIQWLTEARAILRKGTEATAPNLQAPAAPVPGMPAAPTMQPNAASMIG